MARLGKELSPKAEENCRRHAEKIAERLKETNPHVVDQLYRTLAVLGPIVTKDLLEKAVIRQASNKPLMTNDGKRPRTLGGTFFYLAYPHIPKGYRTWTRYGQLPKSEIMRIRREGNDKDNKQKLAMIKKSKED